MLSDLGVTSWKPSRKEDLGGGKGPETKRLVPPKGKKLDQKKVSPDPPPCSPEEGQSTTQKVTLTKKGTFLSAG